MQIIKRFIVFALPVAVFIVLLGLVANGIISSPKRSFAAATYEQAASASVDDVEEVRQLTDQLVDAQRSSNIGPKSLSEDDPTKSRLVGIAKKRKALLLRLAEKDPRLFLSIAMKKTERSLMPAIIQDYLEKEATVEGKTEVYHIDDFKNPANSEFSYFLKIDNKKLAFYPTQELFIASGAKVRVKGIQLENVISADTNRASFQVLEEAPKPESVGDQKTLVFLVRYQDSPDAPFTKEKAFDLVFNDQFQKFYKEQSYNQVSFSGDVFGWFTLPSECECSKLAHSEIQKIILENNINLGAYDRSVFLLQGRGSGASSVGKFEITINDKTYHISNLWVGLEGDYGPPHPFEWTYFDSVLSHEMGHSLGLDHANGWHCKKQVLYGDCTHIEYGNSFDTMGWATNSLHFNAFYKELLGWASSASAILINTSGTYTINPLELDSNTKLAKIKILGSDIVPFYLEYRKGIGFDANLNKDTISSNQLGLFVNHVGKDFRLSRSSSRLLDMSPTSEFWGYDPMQFTLNGENTFTDPGRGITIGPITQTNEASITFDVKLTDPACVHQDPAVEIVYHSSFVAAGSNGYATFKFTNMDYFGCGESEFTLVPTLPLGWTYEIQPEENITLAPEQKGYKSIQFTVSEDASIGDYSIGYDAVNLKSGIKTHVEFNIAVKPAPKIIRIDPQRGPIGTKITIFGSGFDEAASNNFIYFYNPQGHTTATSESFQLEGEQALKFTIPDTICVVSGKGAPQIQGGGNGDWCGYRIKTPLGGYEIYIYVSNLRLTSNRINFEVTEPASITVLSPNGGEKLKVGKEYEIKYNAAGVDKVIIELTKGKYKRLLSENAPAGKGAVYKWKPLRQDVGRKLKIHVRGREISADKKIIRDASDKYFSVVK